MTYLQLVNAVLRRLRRQEVSSVSSSSYATHIGDLVNQAKREVEDAWNWLELQTITEVSAVASTATYTLSGYGQRYQIRQVHNTTRHGTIRPITHEQYRRRTDFTDTISGPPDVWVILGYSGGDPQITFWPVPDEAATIKVYAKVCQADLSANADELTVPDWPVILGAYANAVAERGEDGGTTSREAILNYTQALSDAIQQDSYNRAHDAEAVWTLV